ncbi:MAG: hypothetical protein M1827_006966 [Pycnora praestabilis]|nr:MAG: hypothetical protein M1827_006966 [Pycnora praestabilis]
MAEQPRRAESSPSGSNSSSNFYSEEENEGGLLRKYQDESELESEDEGSDPRHSSVFPQHKHDSSVNARSLTAETSTLAEDGSDSIIDQARNSQSRESTDTATSSHVIQALHKRKRGIPDALDPGYIRPESSNTVFGGAGSNGGTESWLGNRPLSHSQTLNPAGVLRASTKRAKYSQEDGKGMIADLADNRFTHHFGSSLPPEIWQYIFTHVPPLSLGQLLQVNRAFGSYLRSDKKSGSILADRHDGVLKPVDAEIVWSTSRKTFFPGMPKPLLSLSELDMWKLVRGINCQFCGKIGKLSASKYVENSWQAGPGEDGVRIIWPFGIRSCGPCLQAKTEKEVSLLFSPVPSCLLPALPFTLLTPTSHYIPSTILQNSVPPPATQLTKHYFKSHLEDIQHKFLEVKTLGAASAEEWVKGLESEGKDKFLDASRWEKWDARGGVVSVNAKSTLPTSDAQSMRTGYENRDYVGDDLDTTRSSQSRPILVDGGHHSQDRQDVENAAQSLSASGAPQPPRVSSSGVSPRYSDSPIMNGFAHPTQGSFQQMRVERSIRDVNEAKAVRRAEIERRCMDFSPPLPPNVLNHMESFQAAIQISTPLTQSSWDVLKPRILAQREVAEKRENDRVTQTRVFQAKFEERRHQESQLKEAKEVLDREWDEVQAPIRDRIGLYADEIIRNTWDEGKAITKDTSPKFAADVLLYVRKRFYNHLTMEDDAARAAGEEVKRDLLSGPPTRKLILENMKWLFDTKIKPLSEQYRKELFLCNGCDNNFKFYGFEGVIQHYAAKHTNTLSVGSIVVHWRAEWPEHPPFHPDPSAAKAAFYAIPNPSSGPGIPMHQTSYGYGGYSQAPGSGPQMAAQGPHGYPQFSPSPYGSSQYPDQYHAHQYGPFAPPPVQSYQAHNGPQNFQVSQQNYHQGSSNGFQGSQFGYHGHQQNYQGYTGSYQGQQPQVQGQSFHGQSFPLQLHGPDQQGMGHFGGPISAPYNQPVGPVPAYPHMFPQQAPLVGPMTHLSQGDTMGQPTGIYQVQLEEVANNARDIWFGTSGIKDLAASVRIYVVFHHVVSRFKARFTNEPSLLMFSEGLANHSAMKPIKNVSGLACKACASSGNGSGAIVHSHPRSVTGDRKLYTLPSLLSHFQALHIERAKPPVIPQTGIATPRLNWKEDMIELPEDSMIRELVYAHGMDDKKLYLIAQVLPGVFPSPLPRVGLSNATGPIPVIKDELEQGLQASLNGGGQPADARSNPLSDITESDQRLRGRQRPYSSVASDLQYSGRSHRASVHSPELQPQPEPAGYSDGEYIGEGSANIDAKHRLYLTSQHRFEPGPYNQQSEQVSRESHRYHPPPRVRPSRIEETYTGRGRPSHYATEDPKNPPLDRAHGQQGLRLRSRSPPLFSATQSHARHSVSVPAAGEEAPPLHAEHSPLPQNVRGRSREMESSAQASRSSPNRHDTSIRRLETVETGSEDGEVGDHPGPLSKEFRPSSPIDGLSAAERFLNEFRPGEDTQHYKRNAPERERILEVNKLAERGVKEWERRAADEPTDIRSFRSGVGGRGESIVRETPIRTGPLTSRNGHRSPSPGRLVQHPFEYNHSDPYQRSIFPRSQPRERSPEFVGPRYVKNLIYQGEHHYPPELPRRSRSRYERYEALRHEPRRTRSRSPHSAHLDIEEPLYGTRELSRAPYYEQEYRTHSPPPSHAQLSAEVPTHQRPSAQTQYRYVDDQRNFGPVYGEAVDYIPVRAFSRESYLPGSYVVSHPVDQGAMGGYLQYDDGTYSEPMYESQGQLYRAEPRGYQNHEASSRIGSQSRHVQYHA